MIRHLTIIVVLGALALVSCPAGAPESPDSAAAPFAAKDAQEIADPLRKEKLGLPRVWFVRIEAGREAQAWEYVFGRQELTEVSPDVARQRYNKSFGVCRPDGSTPAGAGAMITVREFDQADYVSCETAVYTGTCCEGKLSRVGDKWQINGEKCHSIYFDCPVPPPTAE